MADKKSTSVTNADARTPNDTYYDRGDVFVSSGKATVAAADNDGQVYRICRLPSKARVISVKVTNGAITAGTDYDLGIYEIPDNGSAVVVKDCLVDGDTMATARAIPTETLGTGNTLDNEQRLWEAAALTADTKRDYDVCYTANTVGTAAGTITVDILWTW